MSEPFYRSFRQFLTERFGERVHRIALDGGFTCPNVDGTVTTGGCVYCDNRSFSPNRRLPRRSIREQMEHGMNLLRARYGTKKFLAYFQAGTNTHGPVEKLRRLYDEALAHPDIVGLMIGTRPDCLPEPVLDLITEYAHRCWVCLEIGLQSIHDRSLRWMNRGHDAACFVDAVQRSRGRGFDLCVHVILGLPGETPADMMETAEACAAMELDAIKIHNLHVVRDTPLEEMYHRGEVPLPTLDEYIRWTCDFMERLPPAMVIHRLSGEAPRDYLVAPQWCREKGAILRGIENEFRRRGTRQGARYRAGVFPRSFRTALPVLD
ncbi:MAG: TIGR01212 family radical SAM protein [Gemmataceae bacterium]|nr:TIGR01212 family radical SAM protein [Gemmataceae bacterium]